MPEAQTIRCQSKKVSATSSGAADKSESMSHTAQPVEWSVPLPQKVSQITCLPQKLPGSAYDMLLYLDTHPDDAQALSYYNQCNELYNSAKKTYEERFEPLSAFGSQPLEDWDWNDGPMPWEGVK